MTRTAALLPALLLAVALAVVPAVPAGAQEGQNPFTSNGPAPERSALAGPGGVGGIGGAVLAVLAPVQKELNDSLAAVTESLKGSGSLGGLLLVLGLSLAYGAFHAAGPGHGKTVVSSYFVAREPRLGQVLLVGNVIALVHALSALTVVLVLSFLVRGIFAAGVDSANLWIQRVSFAAITVIGGFLLVQRIRGKEHSHAHVGHGHDHGHGAHGHDHGPGHGPAPTRFRSLLAIAVPAGMIPCPGAVAVVVFALSLHLVWVSILSVAAMSLGMGMTISASALLVLLAKRGVLGIFSRGGNGGGSGLRRGIEIAGAAALFLFGAALLVSQF